MITRFDARPRLEGQDVIEVRPQRLPMFRFVGAMALLPFPGEAHQVVKEVLEGVPTIFIIGRGRQLVSFVVKTVADGEAPQSDVLVVVVIVQTSVVHRCFGACSRLAGLAVAHFAFAFIPAVAALEVNGNRGARQFEVPPAFQSIMIAVARARTDGMGRRRLVAHDGHLLLVEIALAKAVGPLSADVPARAGVLLRQ